jgi:hypothetical protein
MSSFEPEQDPLFQDALEGLKRGDFSRLAPLFEEREPTEGFGSLIVEWYVMGGFQGQPKALAEALTCACFLGRTRVARFLLDQGVDPAAGNATGMTALHWAANRGELEAVLLLIEWKAPLETLNMYGGTALAATVWAAIHEPRANQMGVIEALIRAGARIEGAGYPTGHVVVDELLQRLCTRDSELQSW